jgi:hypothetical protein
MRCPGDFEVAGVNSSLPLPGVGPSQHIETKNNKPPEKDEEWLKGIIFRVKIMQ